MTRTIAALIAIIIAFTLVSNAAASSAAVKGVYTADSNSATVWTIENQTYTGYIIAKIDGIQNGDTVNVEMNGYDIRVNGIEAEVMDVSDVAPITLTNIRADENTASGSWFYANKFYTVTIAQNGYAVDAASPIVRSNGSAVWYSGSYDRWFVSEYAIVQSGYNVALPTIVK